MRARIQFDGGCRPNPGHKYGSYSIDLDGSFEITRLQFPLGFGTNNEAEFESLIAALAELQKSCRKAGVSMKELDVSIFTDSTIVRNWIQNYRVPNPKNIKNPRRLVMGSLATQCIQLLSPFKAFTIEWNSRDRNVEKFGH